MNIEKYIVVSSFHKNRSEYGLLCLCRYLKFYGDLSAMISGSSGRGLNTYNMKMKTYSAKYHLRSVNVLYEI